MTDTTSDDPDIQDCCPRADAYPGDTPTCNASNGGVSCTRPVGHPGPHSACTVARHQIETWTDTS